MNLRHRRVMVLAALFVAPGITADSARSAEPVRPALEWPIYRGDASRSNRGAGSPPYLEAAWRQSMLYEKSNAEPARRRLRQTEKVLHERHEPIVPAFVPVAVTISQRGKNIPLLLCRNHFGVMALDARDGRLTWLSPSSWSLQRVLDAGGSKTSAIGEWLDHYQREEPQIVFENSTVGTLSTDGQFVYAVEDLAIPPWIPGVRPKGGSRPKTLPRSQPDPERFPIRVIYDLPEPYNFRKKSSIGNDLFLWHDKELADAVSHNRLLAYHLAASGKLTWALGEDEKDALHDAYFLAPPLPLDGLLYLLIQRKQQVSLVCVDPDGGKQRLARPKIVFVKPLVELSTSLIEDPIRRTQAAHLAYDKGILVCPTNAGVVLGVDRLSRRVVWTYPYAEKRDEKKARPNPSFHPWKTTAPTLADGKVILAPPDDPSLHCLNLADGKRLWSRRKNGDDLYLGGVARGKVLIVGARSVQALNLANGETLWTRETGLPSGQGVLAGDSYYLPLQRGLTSRQPEIVVLNVDKGQVIAHNRTRPRTPGGNDFDTPGNLVFVAGKLISQSAWEIAAYPPYQAKLDEATKRVERNPNDSAGLIERATLRRNAGEQAAAIEDLRKVLKSEADKATRRRASALLFETLTELFQRDLRDAERHLTEYKQLAEMDQSNLIGDERAREHAEQQRRLESYHLLVARLRESQGRLAEALPAYLDFAGVAPREELLPLPDEPAVKVRVEVWVRGRIAELLKNAPPPQRQGMEQEMKRRLQEAEKNKDVRSLRDFLEWVVGPETATGREARLLLAEHLLDPLWPAHFLEAELLVLPVSRQGDDLVRAARAVELLARLLTAQGQLPDAVVFYRHLRRDFAQAVLANGKTGTDLWNALADDKRFLPYLDESHPFAARRFAAHKETGDFPMLHAILPFEPAGAALPFFRRHLLGLEIDRHTFHLQERTSGADVWTARLTPTSFRALLPDARVTTWPRFRYSTAGHLVVLRVDNLIFALDPIGRRILWQHDTLGPTGPSTSRAAAIAFDPRDGGPRLLHPDGWMQLPGRNLVLSPSVLCLATRTGLHGRDPLTGRLLWTRADLPRGVRLFGDEEHVFVVEEDAQGMAVSTRTLRLANGATVATPDFTAAFASRVQVHGRTLVLSSANEKGAVSLRLYDLPTGAIMWEGNYPKKSFVLHSEEPRFTGAVEPDGKVHIVDVEAHKEVMTGKITEPAERLRNVETIHLLADADNFYLACSAPAAGDMGGNRRQEEASRWTDLGRRGLVVNGMLYAFARANGELSWYMRVRNQRLVLQQFRELPLLFLTSYYKLSDPFVAGNEPGFYVSALCLQKRDGRRIYSETRKNGEPFYAVRSDPRTGAIEFLSPHLKVVCEPRERQQKGGK